MSVEGRGSGGWARTRDSGTWLGCGLSGGPEGLCVSGDLQNSERRGEPQGHTPTSNSALSSTFTCHRPPPQTGYARQMGS